MILVLNCGSQSIKWKLFDEKLRVEKEGSAIITDSNNYKDVLIAELNKIKEEQGQINKIGHRVVHGGNKFLKPIKITPEVSESLEKLNYLAPLHNPYNVLGIKICGNIFQTVPQFAVFDTEFYAKLQPKVYTYPLPENIREKYGFRRFGFHGVSHEYVAKKACEITKKPFNRIKIISCHLGGGVSVTAIKDGAAIDTSMGFSPLSGAIMMTRPGDIDDEIIFQMVEKFGAEKTREILNHESGLKGICGANNMLEILDMIKSGDKQAKLALDVFVYSIQKYIGSYFAILGGCDLLIFTGAIGFGSQKIRGMICKDLSVLKKTKILSIETNEELAIAQKI
mgnify:CR=1 FL=1